MNTNETEKTGTADGGQVSSLMQELAEERKQRQGLEQKLNDLTTQAEEQQRSASIRGELQKLGVAKVDLAFKAVKDDLRTSSVEEVRSYLAQFVADNPELLPARIAGGSGAAAGPKGGAAMGTVDLERIRPGMSAEEMERVRQEIARVASQTLRGGW